MFYLTIKVIHIFFAISWFAGIFYLPRIFVNIAAENNEQAYDRLLGMSKRLLSFTRKLSLFTIIFGLILAYILNSWTQPWFIGKCILVGLLLIYQGFMVYYHKQFTLKRNTRTHVYFRFFNELPVFILIGILLFVVFKNILWI